MTPPTEGTSAARARPSRTDVALGLAAHGVRTAREVGNAGLVPVRLASRTPGLRVLVRRVEADLGHTGVLARERLVARAEVVFAAPELARTVDSMLAGPLTEAVARSLVENRVIERVADEVVTNADLDRVVDTVLEDPRTAQLLERALASPGLERLIVQVLESQLVDAITERLLVSPEIERVVDYVASSPQVRDAVTRQTQSFAEEMAEGVRRRTHRADDRAESTVRSWLHRPRPQTS